MLSGPRPTLDPRVHAYRPDLADVALAARLFAPHYAKAEPAAAIALVTAMLDRPGGRAVSELARGEAFAVLDRTGGWAWGYSMHDGYVGYVPADALGAPVTASHVVASPAALVFAEPDIKSAVLARWPLGTRFEATEADGGFVATEAGYVHARHVRGIDQPVGDAVAVAEALVGTPYRWGGRGGDGIDCSGLVQRALGLARLAAPRDSDQQRVLGEDVAEGAALRRGDLVFLPGHVGIMSDADRLVHANAHWMAVTVEPLADVLARAGGREAIVACRRLG